MPTEKEQVYAELTALRHRVYAQRQELTALRKSATAKEAAIARDEAANYRRALSNIQHRIDNGGIDEHELRSIVARALLLRGLKTKAARKRFRREMQSHNPEAAHAN